MTSTPSRNIVDVMTDLFGRFFNGPSWDAWRAFLAVVFALPMSAEQAAVAQRCTGRQASPVSPARQAWMIVGRRGGKSRIAALLAVFLACFRRYTLAPGERGVVMVIAADRRQARVVFRYIRALIKSAKMLASMVDGETKEAVHLSNRISIEVHTASRTAVRGYTVVGAILDEIAFWPTDDAANPDHEILDALLPAMATVPDALLIALSSPYARRGELFRAYEEHFGKNHDPVLVWQADSQTMNPSLPQSVVDDAYARDEVAAAAEYGAQFRRDVEALISPEVVDAVIVSDRASLLPCEGITYQAFVDPAGGSGTDSFTCAIGHSDNSGRAILDCLLERKPPFSPEATVEEFAATLHRYRVTSVIGDHYAGEWPREQFRKHGIDYETSSKTKSAIYREVLAAINSRQVELLAHHRLRSQLIGLERRVSRGGGDSIDHGPGGHDDVANAVAGVVVFMGTPSWTARIVVTPIGGPRVNQNDLMLWLEHGDAAAYERLARARREAQRGYCSTGFR